MPPPLPGDGGGDAARWSVSDAASDESPGSVESSSSLRGGGSDDSDDAALAARPRVAVVARPTSSPSPACRAERFALKRPLHSSDDAAEKGARSSFSSTGGGVIARSPLVVPNRK